MDNSLFSGKVEAIFSKLLVDLWDRLGVMNSDGTPKAEWIYPGKIKKSTATSAPTSNFEELIQKASEKYEVDADLVKAVIKAESNFNASAVSSAGAQGLMQLMPATAASLGVENTFDPAENIEGGVKLLHSLLKKYNGNVSYALAAYNAGSGAVDRYGGIPPYQETQTYVSRVLGYLQEWSA